MTVTLDPQETTTPMPQRAEVNIWAFVISALLAPLSLVAVGIVGLHIGLMITAISAAASLPGYILLGLPAAWLAIRHGPDSTGQTPDIGRIVVYALIAVAALLPLGLGYGVLLQGHGWEKAMEGTLAYTVAGLIFGPIEALLFAYWYRKLTRNEAPRTDPRIFS